MNRILLMFTVVLFLFKINAQNYNSVEDSIRNVIVTTDDQLVVIENYKILGFQLKTTLDSSIFYLKKAIEIASKEQNSKELGSTYGLIGNRYYEHEYYDSSIVYFNKMKVEFENLSEVGGVATALNNIGKCKEILYDYEGALEKYTEAIDYGNNYMASISLASLYAKMGKKDEANSTFKNLLNSMSKTSIEKEKQFEFLYYYCTLSSEYAKFLYEENKIKEAITVLKQSEEETLDLNLIDNEIRYHNDMGTYFQLLKELDSSSYHFKLAISLAQNNKGLQDLIKSNYVTLLVEMGEYSEAKIIALDILDRLTTLENIEIVYSSLSDIEAENKNYKLSNSYLNQAIDYKDSIFEALKISSLAEADARYRNEKKQKEILVLKQNQLSKDKELAEKSLSNQKQKVLIYGLLGLLLALLSLGYFFNYKKRIEREKQKAEAEKEVSELEQKALKTQIKTHFIFNAIDVAQGFIIDGNYEEARRYLGEVARLIRLTLENASESKITLEDEINCLKAYLKVCHLLYKDSFEFNVTVNKDIAIGSIELPPMLFQPFIENSIIHGAIPSNSQTNININFSLNNEVLACTIIDDGIGIENAKTKLDNGLKRKSMGMDVTLDRLRHNNKAGNIKNDVLISSNRDGKGTKVDIKVCVNSIY